MDPARMFKESLTSRPELENSQGHKVQDGHHTSAHLQGIGRPSSRFCALAKLVGHPAGCRLDPGGEAWKQQLIEGIAPLRRFRKWRCRKPVD